MPLSRGRDGKLGIAGGGGEPTIIVNQKIYLDGQEITGRIRVVTDKVIVDRNKSGVSPTTRVYQ